MGAAGQREAALAKAARWWQWRARLDLCHGASEEQRWELPLLLAVLGGAVVSLALLGSPLPRAGLGGFTGTAWMDITDFRGLGPVRVSTCSPGICADSTS